MKYISNVVFLGLCVAFYGCESGFTVVQFGDEKDILPKELVQFDSGSLSTVWYKGSDDQFHYFDHFVKTSTKYRISKSELDWPDEFSIEKNRSIHAGDILRGLMKNEVKIDAD